MSKTAKTPRERVRTEWKVHTPAILKEILTNKECSALARPLQILADILGEVASRAIELNDPEMNALMLRLTLYEQGDAFSPHYSENAIEKEYAKSDKKTTAIPA